MSPQDHFGNGCNVTLYTFFLCLELESSPDFKQLIHVMVNSKLTCMHGDRILILAGRSSLPSKIGSRKFRSPVHSRHILLTSKFIPTISLVFIAYIKVHELKFRLKFNATLLTHLHKHH